MVYKASTKHNFVFSIIRFVFKMSLLSIPTIHAVYTEKITKVPSDYGGHKCN